MRKLLLVMLQSKKKKTELRSAKDRNKFEMLFRKLLEILCTLTRVAKFWKSNNKVKSQTKVLDQYTTIGQKKVDTEKRMIGRLCFMKVPDPESRTLL